MRKRNQPSQKMPMICEHCGRMVRAGQDGGRIRIPTTVSGDPERDAIVHTHCINSLIADIEARRQPITPTTQFIPAKGDSPARRIK